MRNLREFPKQWVADMDACKNMADACDLAHERTKKECEEMKIPMDCSGGCAEHGNDIAHYTDKAQEIFNDYYDEIMNHIRL